MNPNDLTAVYEQRGSRWPTAEWFAQSGFTELYHQTVRTTYARLRRQVTAQRVAPLPANTAAGLFSRWLEWRETGTLWLDLRANYGPLTAPVAKHFDGAALHSLIIGYREFDAVADAGSPETVAAFVLTRELWRTLKRTDARLWAGDCCVQVVFSALLHPEDPELLLGLGPIKKWYKAAGLPADSEVR